MASRQRKSITATSSSSTTTSASQRSAPNKKESKPVIPTKAHTNPKLIDSSLLDAKLEAFRIKLMKDFKAMIRKELAHDERTKTKPEISKAAVIAVQDEHAKLLYYEHGGTSHSKLSRDFKEWFRAKLLALHPDHQLSKDANDWIERMFIEKIRRQREELNEKLKLLLLAEWEKRDPLIEPRRFRSRLANSKHTPRDLVVAAIAQIGQSVRGDEGDEHAHSEAAIEWWVEHIRACASHTGNGTQNTLFELITAKWAKMAVSITLDSESEPGTASQMEHSDEDSASHDCKPDSSEFDLRAALLDCTPLVSTPPSSEPTDTKQQDTVKEMAKILNGVKQLDDPKGTGKLEAEMLKSARKLKENEGIDDEGEGEEVSKAKEKTKGKRKEGKRKRDSEKDKEEEPKTKPISTKMGPPKEQVPRNKNETASQPAKEVKTRKQSSSSQPACKKAKTDESSDVVTQGSEFAHARHGSHSRNWTAVHFERAMSNLYHKFELEVVWNAAKSKLTVILPAAVLEKFDDSIVGAINKLYTTRGDAPARCVENRKGICCFWDKPPINSRSFGKSITIGYLKTMDQSCE